jgi:hypothetical protein
MSEVALEYVEQLASQLSAGDQQLLAEHLTSKLRNRTLTENRERNREDLYGIWRGKFPEELDIEKEIREIRGEWKKELEEFGD